MGAAGKSSAGSFAQYSQCVWGSGWPGWYPSGREMQSDSSCRSKEATTQNKYLNLMSEWSADRENSSSKKVHICKPALLLWIQKTAGGSSIMPEMMIQPSKQPTRALPTLVNLLLLLMM